MEMADRRDGPRPVMGWWGLVSTWRTRSKDRLRDSGPLNDALRDKLDLRGPMKGFVIYFVESVEFADGSSYKDETTYKALRLYLEDLGEKVYQADRKSAASP